MTCLPASLNDLCHGDVAHCVVLSPPNAEPSDAAARLAQAVIGDDVFVNDSLEAFAELALQDRLNAFRKAWGLRPIGLTCLIVDRPTLHTSLSDVIDAADAYLDDVVVVQYDPQQDQSWRDTNDRPIDAVRNISPAVRELLNQRGAMRSSRTSSNSSHNGNDSVRQQHVADDRRGLRYVDVANDDHGDDDDDIDVSSPVVTREELAMLLGQDDADDDSVMEHDD